MFNNDLCTLLRAYAYFNHLLTYKCWPAIYSYIPIDSLPWFQYAIYKIVMYISTKSTNTDHFRALVIE